MLLRSPLIVGVISTAAVHAKIPVWEQELSAGAVCMNLLHAADALGFGAVWLTGWSIFDDRARPLYGLKEGERIAGLIYLGAQTEAQEDRPRPELSTLVTVL
jgi:nitroreductase